VLNGTQSLLASTGEEIIDLLKGGQGVLNIVPLSGVVSELDAAIHDLAARGAAPAATAAPPAAGPAAATVDGVAVDVAANAGNGHAPRHPKAAGG
jgi:hypothetical protein